MSKKSQRKIRDFILTNHSARRLQFFWQRVFLPFFIKAILITLTTLVLIFGMLKIFKPTILDKIYQRSSFYFFHYLNLDNHQFNKINISGNKRVKKEEIISIIDETQKHIVDKKNGDYQPLIQQLITDIKNELPWVNQIVITRSMPNVLNIAITEYEPFALWQNEGKKYIIDKEGHPIPYEDLEEFKHFVILSGKGANTHAKALFNIFVIDPNLSANVYSATWIGDRRWDIRFENGLVIKLPESNISLAWKHLIKIYNMPGSIIGLKMIDLRIDDKAYLEYEDSLMKELQNL
jgi:cell division protein FtsQ